MRFVLLLADGKLTWYVARAAGLMAWALSAASIVVGLASASRRRRRPGVRSWLAGTHRYLATLTVVFTALHLVGLVLDDFVQFGPAELAVPMASSYRPGAVAWGIVATYALAAVQITSWTMSRLPRRVWRAVHLLAVVVLVAGTVHGITAGTDGANRLLRLVGALTLVGVSLALVARIRARREPATSPDAIPLGSLTVTAMAPEAEAGPALPRERVRQSDQWLARRLERTGPPPGPASRPRPAPVRSEALEGGEVPRVVRRGLRALATGQVQRNEDREDDLVRS